MKRPLCDALYAQCPLVDGTRAYAVGLVAAGPLRDASANRLPVPRTSLTSKLAQLLPTAVADTLTINEVRYSTVQYGSVLYARRVLVPWYDRSSASAGVTCVLRVLYLFYFCFFVGCCLGLDSERLQGRCA